VIHVPPELIDALSRAECPVVAGHINPDADALGAMFALTRAMPGNRAAVALPDSRLSQRLRFIRQFAPEVPLADEARLRAADVLVAVDTAGTNRLNISAAWDDLADTSVLNIDHHITNTDYGHINWVVDNASSTCELVYHLITQAAWPLDASTASMLYAGLYADTAGFSLPTTTAEVFEVAAALARAGALIEVVAATLMRSQQPHEFELVRTVYHNTHVTAAGRIAYATLSHDEITAAGCTPDDIDDQVSIPRSLSGVKVAILFSEGVPGIVRINLRGEDGTPVLPIAEKIGGGGHTFSAGARVRGPLHDVIQNVLHVTESTLTA
jgi:phosphoesterase RecJ-like protein